MPHDNCEDRFLEMATQPANRATKPRSGRRRRAGCGRERVDGRRSPALPIPGAIERPGARVIKQGGSGRQATLVGSSG